MTTPINPVLAVLRLKQARVARLRSTLRADLLSGSPGSRTFYQDTPAPFPAYPAPGTGEITILAYRVPSAMSGVLTKLAIVHFGPGAPDGSGNVVWRVKVNGAAEKGLNYVVAQLGSLSQPSDISMILTENDVVSVTVEVPAGQPAMDPTATTGARVQGWLDVGGNSGQLPAGGTMQLPSGNAATAATTPTTGGNTGGTGTTTGTAAPAPPSPAPAPTTAGTGTGSASRPSHTGMNLEGVPKGDGW